MEKLMHKMLILIPALESCRLFAIIANSRFV